MIRFIIFLTAALGLTISATTAIAASPPPSYTLKVLPLLPNSNGAFGSAINDRGEVSGTISILTNAPYYNDAFVYRNGRITDLGRGEASFLNFFGDTIVYTGEINDHEIVTLHKGNGQVIPLPGGEITGVEAGFGIAYLGLNDLDQFVANNLDPYTGSNTNFFLQINSHGENEYALLVVPVENVTASVVNDRGQIITGGPIATILGDAGTGADQVPPGLYSGGPNGHTTLLEGFPGSVPAVWNGEAAQWVNNLWKATALNNNGEVVGYAQAAGSIFVTGEYAGYPSGQNDEPIYPVKWVNGKPEILGVLPNSVVPSAAKFVWYAPIAVNDAGTVIGIVNWSLEYNTSPSFVGIPDGVGSYDGTAYWVLIDGKMYTLEQLLPANTGGFTTISLVGINNAGQLLVNGYLNNLPCTAILTQRNR